MLIDPAKPGGARALDRLEHEAIIWLTTVTPDGQPQSSPIWFVWRDDEIVVYSLAVTPRVTNIAANPRVALNLNSTPDGDEVLSIDGEARIDRDARPSKDDAEYIAKYRSLLDSYGWTPERLSAGYPLAIRIRPLRARYF